ncbi:MAG: sulfurtransferase [Planctomycetota bacterium]|nr:sulfurtransferase [Planctomycetota bacterium]
MNDYAHPDMLVSTEWVQNNLAAGTFKLVEIDVDTTAYDTGHIAGALAFNWQSQLMDQVNRDIISHGDFETLMGESGIAPDDLVIVYGDNNNWFAAYGLWIMKYYGHANVKLMNGGRVKWAKDGRAFTNDLPTITSTSYAIDQTHPELRAMLPEILEVARLGNRNLVDVRSPDEYTGKVIAPPGMSETAQRAGHIPGAASVPWSKAVNEDGTFKSADELRALYLDGAGVDPSVDSIAYCRIGERSSHTWFVLKYLLGLENVKNYDGSWTEYGNVVGAPIVNETKTPAATATA